MRLGWLGCALLTTGLAFPPVLPAATQTLYLAAGGGPTPVLEGRSGSGNVFGAIAYQGPRGLGLRLSGSETVGRLWLSTDLTVERKSAVVRPYGLLGIGMVLDLSESDFLFTAGAGVRPRLHRLVFALIEARVHAIPGSTDAGPSVILPITFGLGLGK
jgi:hypothetical protein